MTVPRTMISAGTVRLRRNSESSDRPTLSQRLVRRRIMRSDRLSGWCGRGRWNARSRVGARRRLRAAFCIAWDALRVVSPETSGRSLATGRASSLEKALLCWCLSRGRKRAREERISGARSLASGCRRTRTTSPSPSRQARRAPCELPSPMPELRLRRLAT